MVSGTAAERARRSGASAWLRFLSCSLRRRCHRNRAACTTCAAACGQLCTDARRPAAAVPLSPSAAVCLTPPKQSASLRLAVSLCVSVFSLCKAMIIAALVRGCPRLQLRHRPTGTPPTPSTTKTRPNDSGRTEKRSAAQRTPPHERTLVGLHSTRTHSPVLNRSHATRDWLLSLSFRSAATTSTGCARPLNAPLPRSNWRSRV